MSGKAEREIKDSTQKQSVSRVFEELVARSGGLSRFRPLQQKTATDFELARMYDQDRSFQEGMDQALEETLKSE